MKTILVPCDQSDSMPSVLATADQLAAKFESLVEGIALRPVHVEIVAPDQDPRVLVDRIVREHLAGLSG